MTIFNSRLEFGWDMLMDFPFSHNDDGLMGAPSCRIITEMTVSCVEGPLKDHRSILGTSARRNVIGGPQ
jgi:hypothetical protein